MARMESTVDNRARMVHNMDHKVGKASNRASKAGSRGYNRASREGTGGMVVDMVGMDHNMDHSMACSRDHSMAGDMGHTACI